MTVYFIQAGDGGAIKIGTAENVASRMLPIHAGFLSWSCRNHHDSAGAMA